MTPKQKQLKLATIIAIINQSTFTLDHYGNYKTTFEDIDYRIKIKKINIRIESKQSTTKSWYKLTSQPIVNLDIHHFSSFMRRFLNGGQ